MWQDYALVALQTGVFATVADVFRDPQKPSTRYCLRIASMNILYGVIGVTLSLWWSAGGSTLIGTLWLVIAWRSWRLRDCANDSRELLTSSHGLRGHD